MNKFSIIAILGLMYILMGCIKKKDTPSLPSTSCTFYLKEDDITYSGGKGGDRRVYVYNAGNKIVKIEHNYKDGTYAYDTILYDSNHLIDSIKTFNTGKTAPDTISDLVYTNGSLISIHEIAAGIFDRTRTFTSNSSGNLTGYEVNYSSGAPGNSEITKLSSIAYYNGNIVSAVVTLGAGNTIGAVNVSYNTVVPDPSPYFGLPFNMQDPFSVFNIFSAHNPVTFTIPDPSYTILLSRDYKYSENLVVSYTETNPQANKSTSHTISYLCK